MDYEYEPIPFDSERFDKPDGVNVDESKPQFPNHS